ncbi:MAG TPA: 3-deoxy-D-manno-octulosonic acid transferase [Pseudolabrys sp.]|nr:3-deoxy-D-manno-octulosonic acid transferase [Pseudolabrys sp.]
MSARLPAALRAYRVLSSVAAALAPVVLAQRVKRGKEQRERLPERHGIARVARPNGPLIWLHGASVGELLAVLPLIERLRARGVNVLVTSGTVTSGELAGQRLPRGVIHQFVPLDVPRYVRRFLDHWRPDLVLLVEADLWPNMIIEASARSIPLILINARVSERSFRRWNYLRSAIVDLLQRFDLCLAGTLADAERLTALGAPRVETAGNLKLDGPAPPADDKKLTQLKDAIALRPLIAAASTHPGEESAVIAAHQRLRGNFPGLLTIIAPRHPERGRGVVELAAAAGLNAALRSRGERLDAATEIYVADTVGELGLIYRLAPVVFIGGSLIKHGGQNPIEAAKLGAAILHGPNVANFAEIYGALDTAHGAELVVDADCLTATFGALLSDGAARKRAADAAKQTVDSLGGALDRTLQSLEPYLMQLQLRGRTHA